MKKAEKPTTTASLFGAGQIGAMIGRLVAGNYQILSYIDNYSGKWGTEVCGIPVESAETVLARKPQTIFLCVLDAERSFQMEKQLRDLGYAGEIIRADSLEIFDPRAAVMRMLAEQIRGAEGSEADSSTDTCASNPSDCDSGIHRGIPGAIAELGVYRGEFASLISHALPNREFHLFDTFEGFAEADVQTEESNKLSRARVKDFADTSVELVRNRLHQPERAVFHKGWFPETFAGCEDLTFAFVSIDADLYEPTAAALPLFWERMAPGGVIMLHDVYSTQFTGVSKAVDEFCKRENILPMPVCDLHGSAVLRKPLY